MKAIAISFVLAAVTFAATTRANAECNCVSIAADVAASFQAQAARADGLYARGDFEAALALYVQGYAATKAAPFLYAQGMCQWQLGNSADARGLFERYLAVRGELAYRARAEAAIRRIDGGAATLAVSTLGATGELGSRVGGEVAGAGVDAGMGVAGGLDARLDRKPPKVAKGAAIVLGVVAVAAIGAVAIQGIHAGFKDDVDFDTKFGLGMGLSGAVVGGTAIYLWGLTAATGAVAGAAPCGLAAAPRRVIAPVAFHGGGGLTAAMSF